MAKTFFVQNVNRSWNDYTADAYSALASGHFVGSSGTEAYTSTTQRVAGTYSNLFLRVSANSFNNTCTWRFRKNGGNGNQVLSIPSSSTGDFEDTSNTDSVTAGDEASITNNFGPPTSGTLTTTMVGILFDATSTKIQRFVWQNSESNSLQPRYYALAGLSSQSTESLTQNEINVAGTLKNLWAALDVNNNAANTLTYRLRIGGSNANPVISIVSGATGTFEDTTNTSSVSAGNVVNFTKTISGTPGQVRDYILAVDFEVAGASIPYAGMNTVGTTQTTAITRYFPIAGEGNHDTPYQTENNVQIPMHTAGVFSNINIRVTTNTRNGASTYRFRKNAGNGNQSVSIGSSSTGYFEDTSNTDSVNSTDEVNTQLVVGGSSGNFLWRVNSSVFQVSEPTTTNDARDAEVHGEDTANDTRAARITGMPTPVLTAVQNGTQIDLSWTYS